MHRSELARRRLFSQRLTGPSFDRPEEAVRWFGAMQAQEYPAVKWAIAQRTQGLPNEAIDRALADGRLIRTHLMRPTWHVVLPVDLRWINALTGARVVAGNASRSRELELDDATYGRANEAFAGALQGGRALTRKALAGVLEAAGISTAGQRLPHMLMRAEFDQVICSGGLEGKEHTYALFDERVPKAAPLDREAAIAELTWRYFRSHGPATPQDFAWWSGLTHKDIRTGLALNKDRLEEVAIGGKPYYQAPVAMSEAPSTPIAHLLPVYDEHWVAYRDHSMSYAPEVYPQVGPEIDLLRTNAVAVDGLVIGTWRRTLKPKGAALTVASQAPLEAPARQALRREVERYGEFLGLPVAVEGL